MGHPDFSVSGREVQFGFATWNDNRGLLASRAAGIDNWSVVVHEGPPDTNTTLTIDFYAGITVRGPIGSTNRIEYVSILGDTNWMTLTNIVIPFSPFLLFDPNSPRQARRFYRTVRLE